MRKVFILICILFLFAQAGTVTKNISGATYILTKITNENAENLGVGDEDVDFDSNNAFHLKVINRSTARVSLPAYNAAYIESEGLSYNASKLVWGPGNVAKGCLTNGLINVFTLMFGVIVTTSSGFDGEWKENDKLRYFTNNVVSSGKTTEGVFVFRTNTNFEKYSVIIPQINNNYSAKFDFVNPN